MKKLIGLALAGLTLASQGIAEYCGNDCCSDCFGFDSVLTFDVGGGYRNDNLKWKHHPDDATSIQEKWSNIGMGIVEANANFLACEHYLLKADFDYGWFNDSGHQTYKVFDTDVLTDDWKAKVRGNVYDISGGVGYQFNFDCYRASLAPLVGYSYQYQRFKSHKYRDILDEGSDSEFFKNTYTYRWRGPWVGAAFVWQPCCDWLLFFDYAFHWSRLRAKIDEHFLLGQRAATLKFNTAYGNEFTVGANYVFCDWWFMGVKFNYKQFWANKGCLHGHEDEDDSRTRDLDWISYNVTLDIGYTF